MPGVLFGFNSQRLKQSHASTFAAVTHWLYAFEGVWVAACTRGRSGPTLDVFCLAMQTLGQKLA